MTVLSPNQEITYSGTINPSSGKYVEFALPTDCRGTIHYEISFNINDCISAEYTKSFSGTQDVFEQNHPGQASGVIDLNESFLKDAGFVLTNFSANSVASYSIRYYLASTKLVNKTTSNRWYCAGNMNYFNGHGFTGYYFNTQINLTNLDKSYWGTIRVVGLGNTGSTVLENENIDFDSTEGVFNIFFRTSDLNPHGAIFVKYTYEKEINIQKKTVYESENYCFNSFQLNSEFIEGRYKLQFSFPIGRVQQYDWGYVSVENCVINANVDCYNTSCYFNYQEGTFLIVFYSDVINVYGDVDVYYEYETNVQVQSITAIGGKREYVEGEYFDGREVTVTASYSNGEVRTISDFTIDASYYNPNEDGWHLIIVTYTENRITVRTNYFVHVHKRRLQSISLSGNPQTTFECGEAFNYDGLEVIANYEDGNYEYVSDYSIDNANVNMHEAGTYPVYVSYSEDGITVSESYMVVVEQPPIDPSTLKSITLSGNYQTEFAYGEEFNCDGLIVTANYRIGGSEQVTDYEIRTYGFDPYTPGEYPIAVFYSNGGKIVNEFYLVTVGENPHKFESLTLSGNYQTTFEIGDAFNYDGLIVTANFSDGTTEVITDYIVYDDFVDMNCIGEYPVEIECVVDGKTRFIDYEIVVKNPSRTVESIILSGTYKRTFKAGSEFDCDGLIVTANYSDGSSATVDNYTVDISNVDMNHDGSYNVYVFYKYNGKNVMNHYKIRVRGNVESVSPSLESIEVIGANRQIYSRGDTLDFSGISVVAWYNDTSHKTVENFTIDASNVDMAKDGVYDVIVSYTENGVTKTATFTVTVFGRTIIEDPRVGPWLRP